MIKNHDRTGYFGASDTKFITGNWNTKTWEKWFTEKLGFSREKFQNQYTLAGTHYEHSILDAFGMFNNFRIFKDQQIILEDLKLRVNYDGTTENAIYEVKTCKGEWKAKKEYIEQCQVQMFAKKVKQCYILAYPLEENNYRNFFLEIDISRLIVQKIEYDEIFIQKYLERLEILAECLKQGKFPKR